MSPDEMARKLMGLKREDRVAAIDAMQRTAPREMSAREAAKRVGYERALMRTHEMLNKLDR
jgi:hypothetical protein